MRTLDAVLDQLTYHPATPESAQKHDAVRNTLMHAATELWPHVPDGPEKTMAMRALQECGMYSNLAIALGAPVAEDGTGATARVMPS